ncbi:MAG: hypothetical protein CMM91_09830 [Rickettsiales bacterium]|nr:hypothetical protein [Rickettsiales bacterium]
MKKLVHYILIGIMLNWNVAVLAEDSGEGCEWKVIEETETYIQENCVGGEDGSFQARIRSKDIPGLEIIEVPAKDRKMAEKKDLNPIQKFKDKIEKTAIADDKVDQIIKIEKDVKETEEKVLNAKKEKTETINEKIDKAVKEKQLSETKVEDTEKPNVKKELQKKEVDKKSDEKIIQKAEEKEWNDVDRDANATWSKDKAKIKSTWMQIHELLPRIIVENEKIKAAEKDYEAALETLKSEYSAYKPEVTISIGNNWEDDRTPAKGTYPNNTITHDSKQGIQKSITLTQMLWDAGRTSAVVDKAKHTAQQAYHRLELTKEDVIMEALNAWLNLQKAWNTHAANQKVEKNAKVTLSMTIDKVKKGEASKMEQLQIEQQYRTYQTLSMTSQLALDSAIQRFQNVWRFEPKDVGNMPTPIADLLGLVPVQGTPTSNNTTLKIANMDVKIAKEQLRFDEAEFKPRIDGKLSYTEKDGELAGGYDTDSSQKEEWRADITMTWKIFGGFKQTHLTNADKSRLSAANDRYTDAKRQTDEQFKNSWNNFVLVEKNLDTLKRTVEINLEMYNLTMQDYKAGNTPIMAVFGMKTAQLMSEVAYQNAQIDLLLARYQLHKVLGLVDPILQ